MSSIDDDIRELLFLYPDGELSREEEERVVSYLERHPEARGLVEDVEGLKSGLQDLPRPAVPAGFRDRVLDAHAQSAADPLRASTRRIQLFGLGSLAAAAIFVVVVIQPWRSGELEPASPVAESGAPEGAAPAESQEGAPTRSQKVGGGAGGRTRPEAGEDVRGKGGEPSSPTGESRAATAFGAKDKAGVEFESQSLAGAEELAGSALDADPGLLMGRGGGGGGRMDQARGGSTASAEATWDGESEGGLEAAGGESRRENKTESVVTELEEEKQATVPEQGLRQRATGADRSTEGLASGGRLAGRSLENPPIGGAEGKTANRQAGPAGPASPGPQGSPWPTPSSRGRGSPGPGAPGPLPPGNPGGGAVTGGGGPGAPATGGFAAGRGRPIAGLENSMGVESVKVDGAAEQSKVAMRLMEKATEVRHGGARSTYLALEGVDEAEAVLWLATVEPARERAQLAEELKSESAAAGRRALRVETDPPSSGPPTTGSALERPGRATRGGRGSRDAATDEEEIAKEATESATSGAMRKKAGREQAMQDALEAVDTPQTYVLEVEARFEPSEKEAGWDVLDLPRARWDELQQRLDRRGLRLVPWSASAKDAGEQRRPSEPAAETRRSVLDAERKATEALPDLPPLREGWVRILYRATPPEPAEKSGD